MAQTSITVPPPGHFADLNIRQKCAARSYVIWPRQEGERGRAIVTLTSQTTEDDKHVDRVQDQYFGALYWYTRRGDPSSRTLLFRTRIPRENGSEAVIHLLDLLSYPELRTVGAVASIQEDPGNDHLVDTSAGPAIYSIYEVHISAMEEQEAYLLRITGFVRPNEDRHLNIVNDCEVHLARAPLSKRVMEQLAGSGLVNHNDVRIVASSEDGQRAPSSRYDHLFWLNEGEMRFYTRYRDGRSMQFHGSAYDVEDVAPHELRAAGVVNRRLRLMRTRGGQSYERRETGRGFLIDEERFNRHRASSIASNGSQQSFRTASAGEGPQPVEVVDLEAESSVEADYAVIEQIYGSMIGTSGVLASQAQSQPQTQAMALQAAWPKPKSSRELYYENADRLRGG